MYRNNKRNNKTAKLEKQGKRSKSEIKNYPRNVF